ncbi:MAG: HGGxSTG domain-containing protein [Pyrinomonadaceae bacterium]
MQDQQPNSETSRAGANPLKKACGAKTRSGGKCKVAGMQNGRCRIHGGLTPKGIASPNFITGRYSAYLPTNLAARYQTAIQDPKLLELGDEIGFTQALLSERMEKLFAGESRDLWTYLKALFAEYEDALDENDERIEPLRSKMRMTISRGFQAFNVFETTQPIVEQLRKLKESENKRLKDLQATITVQQAMGIIAMLASILKTHISDPKVLAAISEDLARTVNITPK